MAPSPCIELANYREFEISYDKTPHTTLRIASRTAPLFALDAQAIQRCTLEHVPLAIYMNEGLPPRRECLSLDLPGTCSF